MSIMCMTQHKERERCYRINDLSKGMQEGEERYEDQIGRRETEQ